MEYFLLALLTGALSMATLGVVIFGLWMYDGYIQHRITKERRRATPWN